MKKGIVIILVIIGVISWLIYYFAGIAHSIDASFKVDSTASSKVIHKDYLQLVRDTTRLSFEQTITNKTRNPIVQFFYDKKYRINIYKINTYKALKSIKIITTKSDSGKHISYYVTYTPLDKFDNYQISYKSGPQDTVRNVYLDFYRDKTLTMRESDTLTYYYSNATSFSIKYQSNAFQDFFVGAPDEDAQIKISMEVMLIKHNHALYFILLTGKDVFTELRPGTLFNLINE
jgi:hypothetical protein